MALKTAKRLKHDDWLRIGLERIKTDVDLTVDGLCCAAGKTKGSFYHHFDSVDDFTTAMMQLWEQVSTGAVIDKSAAAKLGAGPMLRQVSHALDHQQEVALRRFAAGNTIAANILARVDARRLAYLTNLISEQPDQTKQSAEWIARAEYAVFVGCQVLWPDREPTTLLDADGRLKSEESRKA